MGLEQGSGFEAGRLIYQISSNHYPLSLVRHDWRALKGVYNYTISGCNTGIRKTPKQKKVIREKDDSF